MRGLLQLYAPRCPMTQLPDQYRVTTSRTNKSPPLVHLAIPIDVEVFVFYEYADKHDFTEYPLPLVPSVISPETAFKAVEDLSQYVEYKIDLCLPFAATADCSFILALYNNHKMEKEALEL